MYNKTLTNIKTHHKVINYPIVNLPSILLINPICWFIFSKHNNIFVGILTSDTFNIESNHKHSRISIYFYDSFYISMFNFDTSSYDIVWLICYTGIFFNRPWIGKFKLRAPDIADEYCFYSSIFIIFWGVIEGSN